MRVDTERLARELDTLGRISEATPPVVTRVVYTEADVRGREYVKTLCREAGLALRDWARTNNQDLELLESFITANRGDVWNDCVMVFTKGGQRPPLLICEQYPLALNIRVWPDLGTIRQRRDNW